MAARSGTDVGVQLVACSATASYRLREELCRVFGIVHEAELTIVTPEAEATSRRRKRATGERGIGGVGIPTRITHWWVSCVDEQEQRRATVTVISRLAPR